MQVGREKEATGAAIDVAEEKKSEEEDSCLQFSAVRFPFLAAGIVQSAVASSLLNHKKVHVARHMRRTFPCSFQGCNKTFLKASSLADHMNVHLGKRPYVCKYPGCGKSFRCRSNLSGHRRVHCRDWVEHQEKEEEEEGKEVKATHIELP
ncbi:unnamed protein product [Dibothriocephalus latus]|uniref:C2H2-type domain-containing protein n=1 Tax=Dibothriocephalus latus TaxID=60516 RepID=A0A3P6TVT3_DIBLA|nr:unnamed protein product [Dibothriocephalus latus]